MGKMSLLPDPSKPDTQKLPQKPELFETAENHVFLIKRINREDIRRRFRGSEIGDAMRERRRQFMESRGVTYFDQSSNTTKALDEEDINSPDFEKSKLN